MKRVLSILLTVCLIIAVCPLGMFTITASAATITYTEGIYTYTVTDGNATITDVDGSIDGDQIIPPTLAGYPVTNIGNYAFNYCDALTSITIPENVTSIGNYAFRGCTGLTSVTIGKGVTSIGNYAFDDCTNLTTVNYNAINCTNMGLSYSSVFDGCDNLTTVNIGDGVISIPAYAFNSCNALTSITIPDSVTSIGNYAFRGCTGLTSVTIGKGVTSINGSAFYCCTSLTTVNYNAINCTSMGSSYSKVFDGCDNLTTVNIGDGVISIPAYAFYSCNALTSITIPENVTSIGNYAFDGCTSLTSVTIPNSVTSIGNYAFDDCTNLKAVYITDLAAWCNISFGDSYANPLYHAKNLYLNGQLVTNLVIPESVTSIGNSAFYKCTGFTSITIPNGITSIGYDAFYNCTNLKAVYITDLAAWCNISFGGRDANPLYHAEKLYLNGSLVTDLVIPDSVTSIGNSAFYNCTGLTSVTIPNSVTSIGNYAFENCTNLESVHITDLAAWCNISFGNSSSNNPLCNAKNLYLNGSLVTNLVIPENVTSISEFAFNGCRGLTSITIHDSVTSIGYSAFANCTNLEAVYITDLAAWCNISFGSSSANPLCNAKNLYLNGSLVTNLVIPENVTSISKYAFNGCTGLTSIVIPDSVTSIGNYAFYGCTNLARLNIGNGVTTINYQAFRGCTGLTSIVIPDSVTSINDSAFYDCTGLTSITIPNNVTSIGDYAFKNCNNLTTVNYNAINCTSMGSDNAYTSSSYDPVFAECSNLKTVNIGNGVINIPSYAFYECTSLTSVTIPNSVTSIGNYAFDDCTSLESVHITDLAAWCNISFGSSSANPLIYAKNLYLNGSLVTNLVIPDGVTSIGNYAFRGCIGLTSIVIPDSVTSIGNYAFSNCTGLTSITIPDGVTSIGRSAFFDCIGLTTVNYNAINCTSMGSTSYPVFTGCTGLTTIKIGEKVENIPEYAFYSCSSLISVTLSNSVTSIGYYAFNGCENLEAVYISDLAAWCNITFGNVWANPLYYAKNIYLNGSLVTDLVIPDGTTSIGNLAFSDCTGLKSIRIPDSVTSIGNYAFSNCTNLTRLDIGNGVTTINYQAFRDCSNLTSITIPNSLTNIGYGAFLYVGIDTVWYRGNLEDKGKIYIDSGNSSLKNANWFYNICAKDEHIFTINENLTCEVCKYSKSPDKPILESKTNSSVTLKATDIFEYSKDRINWQDSNIFTDLANNGICNFYQRVKSSDVSTTGETSEGLTVLFKFAQTSIPAAPSISSFTDSEVILVPVTDCEYSIDGINWQSSNIFNNLLPAQKYTFFQRYAETDTHEASDKSIGTTIATDKAKQTLIPNAPTLQNFTKNSITLNAVEGCEYSKDGTTWQESNVFSGLECGTEYTFYQRYKETTTTYAGKCSSALKAKTEKGIQSPPEAPTVISFSDTMVTLKIVSGCEYSKNGTNWQTSNIFTGLSPVTTYTFYQRFTETDKYQTSAKSNVTIQKTDKAKQTRIPNAPTVQSFTKNSITLNEVDGCEYSKNGTAWQESNVFSGLECGTEYTFYQRYKETTTTYAGKSSSALTAKTDKGTQSAPAAPTLEKKTHNSVTLTAISGYEYSRNGINWQLSNVFTGLNPETNYMFYQRKAETDRYYASSSSSALTVKTNEEPTIPDNLESNGNFTVTTNTVSKIAVGTTAEELLGGLTGGEFCKVYKGGQEITGDEVIGTGTVVKIMDGDTVKAEYTVIVTGDINGDGGITITDMLAVKAHILGKSTLSGVYETAADTSGDGMVSITDFIQVKASILGKGEIVAR